MTGRCSSKMEKGWLGGTMGTGILGVTMATGTLGRGAAGIKYRLFFSGNSGTVVRTGQFRYEYSRERQIQIMLDLIK